MQRVYHAAGITFPGTADPLGALDKDNSDEVETTEHSNEQPDVQLLAALARVAERRMGDFNAQELANTAWGLSRHANLTIAWGLFKHTSSTGQCFIPQCIGALLMECEQRDCEHSMGLCEGGPVR